jgi:carboxypeptidase C (cathepsin A)
LIFFFNIVEYWWIIFQTASILFVDAPAGTGFSYAGADAFPVTDTKTAEQVYEFLRKVNNTFTVFH